VTSPYEALVLTFLFGPAGSRRVTERGGTALPNFAKLSNLSA